MSEMATFGRGDVLTARGRLWPWAFTVLALLAYLIWAGSSWDPRSLAMWAPTNTRGISATSGWLVPAPGLPHFLFAAFLLCGALGRLAFAGMACRGMKTWWKIVSAILIFAVAFGARILVLRYWHPWTLSPETLSAAELPAADIHGRWLLIAADMLAILFLLAAQFRKQVEEGRNLWLAAIFAFHPITLLAIANGSRWLGVIPLIVLAAMFAPRLRRWAQVALIAAAGVACCFLLARIPLADMQHPFNGLLPLLLNQLGFEAPQIKSLLLAIGMAREVFVLLLAVMRRWPVARAWVHMIVIATIVSPKIEPLSLLPLIALLPLAWSLSGGLLTAAALAAFGIVLSWTTGPPFVLPDWVIYITMIPVVLFELEALFREAAQLLRFKSAGRPPIPRAVPT